MRSVARRHSLCDVEGFSKPDFWIWTGIIFGVNAVAAALLGAVVLAVAGGVTAFLALLTAAVLARNAVRE